MHPSETPPAGPSIERPGTSPLAEVEALLDAQALARLRELDPGDRNGLLLRVLRTFESSLRRLREQFAAARTAGDPAGLRHVAHTLKSSSASVGALTLSGLCADVEARLREQRGEGLEAQLDAMVAECDRLLTALAPALCA